MLTFDILVHLGTLTAVFVVFWQDIKAIILRPWCKTTALLAVGTVPAVVLGLLLDDLFTAMFSSLVFVALALVLTGLLLRFSDGFHGRRRLEDMNLGGALLIGLFQGLAIMPGLSRSGSTIFGALLTGLRRDEAARFSFLLSIPVILGAAAKQVLGAGAGGLQLHGAYLLGAAVAGLCGYLAIRIFLRLLAQKSLRYFSYYCWAVAAAVLISQLLIS